MSSATAKLKPSLYQVAMPAGILLLAGLSLFYSLQDSGKVTTLSNASVPVAVTEKASPGHVDDINDRLLRLASSRPAHANANAHNRIITDPASSLAQLHASMTDTRAKQDDRDRTVVELDNKHQAEPVDSAWSAQSEVDILSATVKPVVLQAGLKPQDIAADCRSRTCRISARFASSGDAEDWSDRVLAQMGSTLSQVKMTVIQQPDGSSEVRMYGARKPPSRG